jgi:hypothetical protein
MAEVFGMQLAILGVTLAAQAALLEDRFGQVTIPCCTHALMIKWRRGRCIQELPPPKINPSLPL